MKTDMPHRFIADVHLGRLVRMLRMLGIDTAYQANVTRPELLRLAHDEQRILLTRDRQLPHNPFIQVLLIASEKPAEQIAQVLDQYAIKAPFQPFTICLLCNTPLTEVPKSTISHLLPEGTRLHFERFWQCSGCGKVYWQGSHYERMWASIQKIDSR